MTPNMTHDSYYKNEPMFMKTPLLKHLFFLLLMLLGCSGAWGDEPVVITTADDIANNTKKLYLIQTNAFQSFYMVPQSNNTKISTNNILCDDMLWYFLDAGEVGDVQYYYIVNNKSGKYIYNSNGTYDGVNGGSGDTRLIDLIDQATFSSLSDNNKEKCKFKIVLDEKYGAAGFYNIDVKANQTYYGLNKQAGSQTNDNPIRLTNDDWIHDTNSTWKFIPFNGTFTWPAPPFTVSTDEVKHYYKIHNVQNNIYEASTDATPDKVTISSIESNNMAWYFKEAGSDSWNKYYYIVNPQSGKYMYFSGTVSSSDQTSVVSVETYNSANEDRYQFIVLQAARGDGDGRTTCYVIIPKLLRENYWSSNGIAPKGTITNGTNLGIINSRGASNSAHWSFKAFNTYPLVCTAPTITYSTDTKKITLASTTSGNTIYYTTDGTPPSSSNGTDYSAPFDVLSGTTIKAVTTKIGFNDSEVISVTVVTSPTITPTLPEGGYAYDGNPKEPAVTVTDGVTTIPESEYDKEYSKNINAGTTATITITDKVGGNYIVYGSTTFTINKASITPVVTIDDWEYHTTPSTPSLTGNTDNEAVITYEYKVRDAADGSYSTTVPDNVGEYTLRATIDETDNTSGGTATADFEITPKSIGDGVRPLEGFTITMEDDGEGSYTVTVKDGETTLAKGPDYSVSVVGELVTVSGEGNYTGSAKFVSANAKFESTGVSGEYAAAYSSGMDIFPSYVVTPYVVKKVNASIGTLTIAKLDYIPEGVPVLLLAESALTGFTASPIEEDTAPISSNLLSGNPLKVAPVGGVRVEDTEAYLFYKGEFVLTFAGIISAGSFFLYNPDCTPAPPSGSSPRRYLRIEKEEDDATAMDDGQWMQHDEIYDLCGRRVKGQLPKGIYIMNGQKRLIK